ncbi:MAG TPA: flagellar biosynthetic protein FliR [Fimbriimonadaceae bacterium]|nr:flagellar biosynthetic protein FliR [Fimbriimonadaceae bacterium]HRJ96594.1 flagellar biosynthetic protein FliR [Fimbriimonadaceae bacterium]
MLDAVYLFAFFLVFVRCGAMLLVSPIFGASTPVQVRVGLAAMTSVALTPLVRSYIGEPPADLYGLVGAVLYEALAGLLIGWCLQLLAVAAQMAGAFLDIQIGLSTVQVFDPQTQSPVSLFAQFKYLLAVVLLLVLDGHHLMFGAFVESYRLGPIGVQNLDGVTQGFVSLVSNLCLLSLQIAAPVAGVCVIVDAAAGIVNKSVPQMQAFMVTIPAKLMLGIVTLSLTLPIMAIAVKSGVEHTFDALAGILGR